MSDSDDEGCVQYKAVSCMGNQPDSDVFVFGPNLQVSSEGRVIPENEQEYIWIPEIIGCVINPITALPPIQQPLKHVTEGLHKISGENLPSALFVSGILLTTVCI